VIAHAAQRGSRFVSLSVAPLAGASPDAEDRIERLLEGMGRLLEPAYGFRSLAAYKQKFRPEHRPQVLAFADAVVLPAVSVAVARAYLPDLTLPAIARMLGALRPDDEPDGRDERAERDDVVADRPVAASAASRVETEEPGSPGSP
jgi:hypothetical protein